MRCIQCGVENRVGQTYCGGCGARIELTEPAARAATLAEVRRDNWRRAVLALNRMLFLFFVVFLGVLFFNAYARREIVAEFSPGAPLPPPLPLALSPGFIEQPELPLPALPAAAPMKPDKGTEGEILADLAQMARDRLNCNVVLKSLGAVKGVLLGRLKAGTKDEELLVIIGWGPPVQVRAIRKDEVDSARSQLPE